MAWAGLGDICSAEGDEGWVGADWAGTKACSPCTTDIPGDFCTCCGLTLKCRDVGHRLAVGTDWWCSSRCLSGRWCRKGSCRTSCWGKVCCGMQELWSISCSAWCSRSSVCAVGGTGWISDFTNWKLSKIITTRQRCVRAAAWGFVTRRKALCGLAGFLGSSRPLLADLPWEAGGWGTQLCSRVGSPILITVSWLDWEAAGGNPIPADPTVRS